jgi:Tol biopolymer transport system component
MGWISRSVVVVLMVAGCAAARNQVATEHFVVVFEDGLEYWAHEVIRAAEDVWDELMAAYDIQDEYKPVYIYVEDGGDYATGYTFPSRNHVTIGTTALEIDIRSSDNWIRNVVTHELGHVFSIKAANKDGFLKNWWTGRSSVYQNPNVSAAFHYRDLQAPQWWLEGLAQYESYKNGNDRWDTHRDMFLRMAALENDLLDYPEMSVFDSRHGFYPEMTYNQGYSMMLYIDSVYGSEAVRRTAKTKSLVSFNHSLRAGTGLSGQRLYRNWKRYVKGTYEAMVAEVRANEREGKMVFDGGYWDFHGTYSPDGSRVALISNKDYDVLYPHAYVLSRGTGKLERLHTKAMRTRFGYRTTPSFSYSPGGSGIPRRLTTPAFRPGATPDPGPTGPSSGSLPVVLSRIGWSPDGSKLCYSRSADGSAYRDVYVYDIENEREHRVTWQARAKAPSFSPDGETLACIVNDKGTSNLALVGADGRGLRVLTNFNAGAQLFAPCWTPDGKRIVFGILQGSNRDIAIANASAEPFDRARALTDTAFFPDSVNYQQDLDLLLLVHTAADERDPCVSPDGRYLYYASDRTGIFNIYRMSQIGRASCRERV